MNNKGVGAVFCLIAAMLYCTRYLAAAMFMQGISSWNAELFHAGLTYVGDSLTVLSLLALIAGILFLGYGLYQEIREKRN